MYVIRVLRNTNKKKTFIFPGSRQLAPIINLLWWLQLFSRSTDFGEILLINVVDDTLSESELEFLDLAKCVIDQTF